MKEMYSIYFLGRPIVTVSQTSVEAIRNNDTTIPCSVDAYPNATGISWNITLATTTLVHSGATTGKYEAVSPSNPCLTIKTPVFEDSGVYVCIAENEFGFGNSADVSVSVYGGRSVE